jgi:hypothetical protein
MSLLDELLARCNRHRRFLILCTLAPTLLAGILSILLPKYFRAQTRVLPVNSRLSDKARFSGEEISELYSAFGSGDDLDRIYAAARSETVSRKMVDSFQLVDRYGLSGKGAAATELAILKLQKRTDIRKTEYGELQVRAWDKDPGVAAALANAMIGEVERMHHDLYRSFYAGTVASMKQALDRVTVTEDSLPDASLDIYRKSIAEFSIAMQHPPPAVMLIEKAIPAARADRPRIWLNLSATFLVSLFAAVFSVLLFTKSASSAP